MNFFDITCRLLDSDLFNIIHLKVTTELHTNMWSLKFSMRFLGHLWKCIRTKLSSGYQLKLIDSKCMFFAKPDEQIAATSCLIFFGSLTRTPILDPSLSESISARIKLLWLINLMCGWCLKLLLNSFNFWDCSINLKKLCCDVQKIAASSVH